MWICLASHRGLLLNRMLEVWCPASTTTTLSAWNQTNYQCTKLCSLTLILFCVLSIYQCHILPEQSDLHWEPCGWCLLRTELTGKDSDGIRSCLLRSNIYDQLEALSISFPGGLCCEQQSKQPLRLSRSPADGLRPLGDLHKSTSLRNRFRTL